MKIAWALAESLQLPPRYKIQQLQDIAPIWGSWKLWRGYNCDHCICGDTQEAQYCIDHDFYQYCKLYIPDGINKKAPNIVKFGAQGQVNALHLNDIITLHLVGSQHDLVLLLGFDRVFDTEILKSLVNEYPNTQWVMISHNEIDLDNENFTCDLLDNVLQSLS